MHTAATCSDAVYHTCSTFLIREAELLDNRELRSWLALLTSDIDYRVPVRVTRERLGPSPFSGEAYHFKEDFASLSARVARFDSEFAWAEDPPSRTRRFVSNLRLAPTDRADEVEAKHNLLLYRARGDTPPELICGERHDRLRQVDGSWRLARRLVLLDHTSLPTQNLAIFL